MTDPTTPRRRIDLTWVALVVGVITLVVAAAVLYWVSQPALLEPIGPIPSVPTLK